MDGGFAEHYVAFNDDEEEQQFHGETEQGLRIQNFNDVDDSGGNGNDQLRHGGDSSAGKLFVGGLAWETSEGAFTNYFSKYGEVVDSVIMMDKISGRPRGFGFVTFADSVVADKVLEEDHVIDGRPVEVKRTVPREEMQVKGVVGVQRTRKIFIGGIPPSFTEDELREYFSSYGVVAEHQIMFDRETGRSRGFGFVTFQDEETVERIVSDGNMHELGGKEVEIKKAVPKRAGGDFSYDSRQRHGGSGSKPYGGGFSGGAGDYRGGRGGAGDYGGGRGGKSGRGYGAYAGAGYGGYGGNYGGAAAAAAAAAGFYGGYGGYGYGGFGYWGPMYNGGYGGGGFGPSAGYGGGAAIAGYGGGAGAGYGGGKGYGSGGASGGSAASGGSGGASGGVGPGYGGGKGYGSSGGGSGGKGYGNGGAASGRYHPY